jgi:hypothetical protein
MSEKAVPPASMNNPGQTANESMSAVDEDRQAPYADKFLDTFRDAFQTDPLFVSSAADKTFCRHVVPPYNFFS